MGGNRAVHSVCVTWCMHFYIIHSILGTLSLSRLSYVMLLLLLSLVLLLSFVLLLTMIPFVYSFKIVLHWLIVLMSLFIYVYTNEISSHIYRFLQIITWYWFNTPGTWSTSYHYITELISTIISSHPIKHEKKMRKTTHL